MTTVMLPHCHTQLFAKVDTNSWLHTAASVETTVLYAVSKERASHKCTCMFSEAATLGVSDGPSLQPSCDATVLKHTSSARSCINSRSVRQRHLLTTGECTESLPPGEGICAESELVF